MAITMVDHTLEEVVEEVFLSGRTCLKEVELCRFAYQPHSFSTILSFFLIVRLMMNNMDYNVILKYFSRLLLFLTSAV